MNMATAITIAAITALTPTVTCMIAYLLSRQDVRDLRADMRAEVGGLRMEINNQISGLRAEMIALRKDIHAGLLLIHERVAVVEGGQSN